MEPQSSHAGDVHPSEADYGALPAAVVLMLFSQLPLRDMLHAGSTCQLWNRCLSAVWRPRCLSRWRHWSPPPPIHDADTAHWRDVYVRRHKVDRDILQLLGTDVTWPGRKADAFTRIMTHGADALDVLTAAARASTHSGLYVGISHHAHTALQLVQGQLSAERVDSILAAAARGSPAGGAYTTTEVDTGGAASSGLSSQLQMSVTLAAQGEEDSVLEVALQLAQTLHPLSDTAAVRRIVEQLGDELSRRMTAAGAMPGSRQALHLLNFLLFDKPPPSTSTSTGSEPKTGFRQEVSSGTPSTSSSQDSLSSSSSSGAGGCWSSAWPQDPDLFGPDLTGFVVPTDGGLGCKGTDAAYRHASSSCLACVLAQRTGLPITLAVLHRAVGRRAGLDIELVNMPGHVVNRVLLSSCHSCSHASSTEGSGGAAGGSSGKLEADAVAVYVDAFAGLELNGQDLGDVWSQFHANPLPDEPQRRQVLPDMSPRAVCTRMLGNLSNLGYHCWLQHGGGLLGAPILHSNLRLTAALIQLLPRYCKEVPPRLVTALLEQEQHCRSCLDHLYADLLRKGGFQCPAVLATFMDPLPESLEMPLSHSNPHFGPQVLRIGTSLPLRASSPGASLAPELGFVTWRENVDERGITKFDVVMGKDGGSHVHLEQNIAPSAAELLIDPTPAWAATACCDVVTQAQQLLADAWHEGDYEARLRVLLQNSGQQLQAPDDWGRQLAAMKLSSKAIGQAFDAVWYDASQLRCVLVPNSFMRHKFPQG